MNKPFIVLVDGKLWDRKLTKAGAIKLIAFLKLDKGLNATVAEELEGGQYEYQNY